jgi:hypothetical protein
MTKTELQAVLDNPDRHQAQAILNRISRYAGVIKGTRPIGTGDGVSVSISPTVFCISTCQSMTGGRLLMSLQGWPFLVAYSGRIHTSPCGTSTRERGFSGISFRDIDLKENFNVEDFWSRFE